MFNYEVIEKLAREATYGAAIHGANFSCSGATISAIENVASIAKAMQDQWNRHVPRIGKAAYPRLIIGNIYASSMEEGDLQKLIDMGFDVSKEYEGGHKDRIYTFVMLPHEE